MSHHEHHHHHHEVEAKSTKDKLKILLKHWKEHNNSHIIEYEKWMKKVREEGLSEYAKIIEEVIKKMKEVDELYEKLGKLD